MQLTRKLNAALAGAVISAASLTGIAFAAAPAANAASVPAATGTSCKTASATATIKPGIKLSSSGKHTISATFKTSGCTKVSGATGVSGTIALTTKNLACISGSATGTFKSKSNSGSKTSSGTMTLKATSTAFHFTLTGKVTKGYLDGSAISGKFIATPVTGNCVSKAMTKATIKNNGSFKL
jgi:hypothetical protein